MNPDHGEGMDDYFAVFVSLSACDMSCRRRDRNDPERPGEPLQSVLLTWRGSHCLCDK